MRRFTPVAVVACACIVAAACGRHEDTAPPVASIAVSLNTSRAEDRGMRAYEVASVMVAPASNPVMASDGWYDAETGEAPGREWRWSRRDSHLSFANPKTPITLYLQMDQPVASLGASQAVELRGPS